MSLVLKNIRVPLAGFTLETNFTASRPITVLFGPSGSGKTTLLDLVAGLRKPDSARIELDGAVLTDTANQVFIPTRRRGIGYVPQDLALFPHLSVRQNLRYGWKPLENHQVRFDAVAEVLDITALLDRDVNQLSGGERQRVAIARALLASPRLLLLDEPLANLDLPLKVKILRYLKRIRDEFRIPMIYVTHDRYETLSLADEMVVLINGRVAQHGSAAEIFNRPSTIHVAGMLAIETIQPGKIVGAENGLLRVAVGDVVLSAVDPTLQPSTSTVHVCIRADDVIVSKDNDNPNSARNHLRATVSGVHPEGALIRIDLDCGFPLAALLTKQSSEELALKIGEPVVALVKAPHVHLIPR